MTGFLLFGFKGSSYKKSKIEVRSIDCKTLQDLSTENLFFLGFVYFTWYEKQQQCHSQLSVQVCAKAVPSLVCHPRSQRVAESSHSHPLDSDPGIGGVGSLTEEILATSEIISVPSACHVSTPAAHSSQH